MLCLVSTQMVPEILVSVDGDSMFEFDCSSYAEVAEGRAS